MHIQKNSFKNFKEKIKKFNGCKTFFRKIFYAFVFASQCSFCCRAAYSWQPEASFCSKDD